MKIWTNQNAYRLSTPRSWIRIFSNFVIWRVSNSNSKCERIYMEFTCLNKWASTQFLLERVDSILTFLHLLFELLKLLAIRTTKLLGIFIPEKLVVSPPYLFLWVDWLRLTQGSNLWMCSILISFYFYLNNAIHTLSFLLTLM